MSKGNDSNHVSFWFWMFALFVMALPCVGFVMIFVWAFVGENESRKNYFRAVIAWHLIACVFVGVLLALGFFPTVVQQFQTWIQQLK